MNFYKQSCIPFQISNYAFECIFNLWGILDDECFKSQDMTYITTTFGSHCIMVLCIQYLEEGLYFFWQSLQFFNNSANSLSKSFILLELHMIFQFPLHWSLCNASISWKNFEYFNKIKKAFFPLSRCADQLLKPLLNYFLTSGNPWK